MNFLIIEHLIIEPAAIIADVIRQHGHHCTTIALEQAAPLPSNASDYDGIIVMGGPQSANDHDTLMQDELSWVKTTLNANIPMLGICLGAQIMAKAVGADITPSPVRELGWFPIYPCQESANDALFNTMTDGFMVFQWHGETFSFTESMTQVATHPQVPAQAFRLNRAQYGLQFHVEVDESIIEQWIAYGESERRHLGETGIKHLHQQTQCHLTQMQRFCRQMVDAWLTLI
ncbi:type 1 glutamine amidotransferase [Mariprofundus sp. EBB-1]|uniref:type 1 glutamine amidotransferase n=1 Tax=Mariprofundus sp. EBB-1 TaxID=2650971 RepID=UPI000EF1E1FD|nr:type 1 glutamine amidotransferase [Mariprofundus sp. EBB-1]RLL50022.1 type 1 glutamine amidotransferase [Mariprofundus sp. EBB-1]